MEAADLKKGIHEATAKANEKLRATFAAHFNNASQKAGPTAAKEDVEMQSEQNSETVEPVVIEEVQQTDVERISHMLGGRNAGVEDAQVVERVNDSEVVQPREQMDIVSVQHEKEKDPELERLEKTLADTRNLFAETDYRDRTMMYQIRKKLNQHPVEKDLQSTENIEQAKKIYEEARANLKNYRLEKIKQSGLQGEALEAELRDVLGYFNHQEAVNFYDAKAQAKMDTLTESAERGGIKGAWDKFRLGATKVAEAYKKVPVGYKVGLSLAIFGSGLTAAVLGKRAFGAFLMATSGQLQFDRLAQKWDSRRSGKEVEKIIKKAKKENKEIDIDFLDKVLNEKNAQFDKKISKHAMRSHVHKYLAFGAAFLGAHGAINAFDAVEGMGVEGTNEAYEAFKANPANADLYAKLGITDSNAPGETAYEKFQKVYGTEGQTPHADALEGRVAPEKIDLTNGAGAAAQQAAENVKDITYTIPNGSSFIGTLNNHFDEYKDVILKTHPQWQGLDRDQITYRMAQEFADRKGWPEGKLPDLVHAGVKMHLNPETGEIELSGGRFGYRNIRVVDVPAPEAPEAPETPEEMGPPAPEDATGAIPPVEDVAKPQETVPYNPEHDFNKIETEYKFENAIDELNQKYSEAANPSNFSAEGEILDEKYAELGRIDNLRKDVATVLAQMRAEDVPWIGKESVGKILETGGSTKQILKVSLDNIAQEHTNKLAYWNEIKNQPFAEVAFADKNTGALKKGFGAVYMQFKQIIGEKAAQPDVKNGETTGKWLARITRLAFEKQAQNK